MKIKSFGFLIILVFFALQALAQPEIETIIQEGIILHDNGDYEEAIKIYKKALAISPNSTIANYEIALSYLSDGKYKEAVQYSDAVLNQNKDFMIEAYVAKGSALDLMGQTEASIALFQKAIRTTEGHYLLNYNLGLNYYKINDLDNAAESVIKAIELNPSHSSSHLILAAVHFQKGNKVQSLLAAHYFLLLEPNSQRSAQAYTILKNNFGGNVSKDASQPNTINIKLSPNNDDQFAAAEMMISLLEASKTLEKNEGKTDEEMFVENTGLFFKTLGELKKNTNNEIWWTLYTPFFYEIAKSEHLETYCMYITQSSDMNSKMWLQQNNPKLKNFDKWLNN